MTRLASRLPEVVRSTVRLAGRDRHDNQPHGRDHETDSGPRENPRSEQETPSGLAVSLHPLLEEQDVEDALRAPMNVAASEFTQQGSHAGNLFGSRSCDLHSAGPLVAGHEGNVAVDVGEDPLSSQPPHLRPAAISLFSFFRRDSVGEDPSSEGSGAPLTRAPSPRTPPPPFRENKWAPSRAAHQRCGVDARHGVLPRVA